MRPNTERPITCEVGTNILVGTDPERIVSEAEAVLNGYTRPGVIPRKWDGHAAERIADVLLNERVHEPAPAGVQRSSSEDPPSGPRQEKTESAFTSGRRGRNSKCLTLKAIR
jgi:hypothetical protein